MVTVTIGDLLGLLGVYCYVAAAFALTSYLRARIGSTRKILHILAGGIVFFWWSFDSKEVMAGVAALPFLILLLLASPKSPIVRLKRTTLGTIAAEGHSYGMVMYAASWTIIAYFMFDHLLAASIAIAAMSFGDGMGELIGRRYGKIKYLKHRTLEGSAAVFLAMVLSVIVLIWFYCEVVANGYAPPENAVLFALAVAAFAACLEAVSPGRIDNLTVPLVTGGYLIALGV